MDAKQDRAAKLVRLDHFMAERALDAVWLVDANDFGWLLGGDNLVNHRTADGVAAVGYDGADLTVLTSNIEAPRLRAEEVPADVAVESFPWHETTLAEAIAARSGGSYGADVHLPGAIRIDPVALRMPLTPYDIDRAGRLGSSIARGLETACRAIEPADTERAVAAAVGAELAARGIHAPVLLVGGGDRAPVHRHFTPTDSPIGTYALVSVSATRGGLWMSATRTVAFDPPSWLAARHEKVQRVDSAVIRATETVETAGAAFEALQAAYAAVGEAGEWQTHHQGGASGYGAREWVATPAHTGTVHRPQTYAWNPTIRGTKSEDTVLVTSDNHELLTQTGEWPTSAIPPPNGGEPVVRPEILYR